MAYQTGTFTNLNDVLDGWKTFLAANGWTIRAWWRERMKMSTFLGGIPLHDLTSYRFGVRLSASKGNKHFVAQDFYITHDILYGTNGGAIQRAGPGIAIMMSGTTVPLTDIDGAVHGVGVADFPSYTGVATAPSSSIFIMPLPAVTAQTSGTLDPQDVNHTDGIDDGTLLAPFGPAGGAAVPAKYWMFSDASGDNVALVMLHDNTTTLKCTYWVMGDINRAGDWAAASPFIACSHSNLAAFLGTDSPGHAIFRFGAPGSIMDDFGITCAVKMPIVDSSAAGWNGIGPAGRRLQGFAEMPIQGGTGPLGLKTGMGYNTLGIVKASLEDGAPGLPLFLVVRRDNGLLSMIGAIPNIYQANTFGFPMGTETLDKAGTTQVIFDGFFITKTP